MTTQPEMTPGRELCDCGHRINDMFPYIEKSEMTDTTKTLGQLNYEISFLKGRELGCKWSDMSIETRSSYEAAATSVRADLVAENERLKSLNDSYSRSIGSMAVEVCKLETDHQRLMAENAKLTEAYEFAAHLAHEESADKHTALTDLHRYREAVETIREMYTDLKSDDLTPWLQACLESQLERVIAVLDAPSEPKLEGE